VIALPVGTPPVFQETSCGGWWKKQNPTVALDRLEREWVPGTPLIYVGKALSLRERIGELLLFGDGKPVRHWGGRLVWQLGDSQKLLLGWCQDPNFGDLETGLIDEFISEFGRLPFANLKRGDRSH
jgi:hypothetical protein